MLSPSQIDWPRPEVLRAELARRASLKGSSSIDPSLEASRQRCRKLSGFIREAWHVLEPSQPYVHGWHIDVVCDHLEAITSGRFIDLGLSNRLIVNIPPGTMKSLMVGVFWGAWEWGPRALPAMRYLTTSYSEDYAKRDARRTRDLIMSDWYQERWGETVKLVRFGETSFENTAGGWREAMPFQSLTGGRGDRVIIDDPHSTETAESEAERRRTIRVFRESVPTRVNDPTASAIVVIMQRLHEEDVTGVALSMKLGYQHLMLPMEFEPERACETALPFRDPRTLEDELLFPERFPRAVVERDKVPLGSYAVAGQFQQRPVKREGGLFKRAWLEIVGAAPAGTRWVRHWDLAATKSKLGADPAYTAGVRLGRAPDGVFYVSDVERFRDEGVEVRKTIRYVAAVDGPAVRISLPQDPGQAGKVQAHDYITALAGFIVTAEPETGDKVTRAEPIAAQAEAGNLKLVKGEWNEAFIAELTKFPGSKHKDQVDALSGAFTALLKTSSVFTASEADFVVSRLNGKTNGHSPLEQARVNGHTNGNGDHNRTA